MCGKGRAQENRIRRGFHEGWKLLEEAASDASSSGDQCASWNVPVDKLLGFVIYYVVTLGTVLLPILSGSRARLRRFWQ